MADAARWALVLALLGGVFGSFIATVAVRWPASALTGRSRCDGCGRGLRPWELMPIVSWLALRGRSRCCERRIAPLHPIVEVLGVAVGVTAGLLAPDWAGVAGAVFGWLLLALGAIDFVAMRLPNRLTLALAIGGGVAGLADVPPAPLDRAIGGIAGFACLWIVASLYRAARGRIGLGGGDPKLFGGIGLWLGWRALPGVLLIACAVGLIWAIVSRKRGDDRLPFGTLLGIGGFAMWAAAYLP